VKRVFTNYCILSVTSEGLVVEAVIKGASREALQNMTGTPLQFSPHTGVIHDDGAVEWGAA
jgi:acyl CoA:acetate/3-ketoacid CoA transferase beta subunit